MTNIKISEIISEEKSLDKIESYCFIMDINGPKYNIKFGRKYDSPFESVAKNDFYFKMIGSDKIISDDTSKVNLLDRLYVNLNSPANH